MGLCFLSCQMKKGWLGSRVVTDSGSAGQAAAGHRAGVTDVQVLV